MAGTARSALVLQGGGALGAYEYGAERALYELVPNFKPDLISGVSIGAITATLLARPKQGLTPLQALKAFWDKVTVHAPFVPPAFRPYEAFFGNSNFFIPRSDFWSWPTWTYFYHTTPLHRTLRDLVDIDALARKGETPELCQRHQRHRRGDRLFLQQRSGSHAGSCDGERQPPARVSYDQPAGRWQGPDFLGWGAVRQHATRRSAEAYGQPARSEPDDLCHQPFSNQGADTKESFGGPRLMMSPS
jgi:hypothetical protein